MSFLDLKAQVLDAGLCARCGACEAVCPSDVIAIDGNGVPRLLDPLGDQACGSCDLCTSVCPGQDTGVPASERRIFGRTRTTDERWTGIVRRTAEVHSNAAAILERASAGGAVTALLLTALRARLVDAVLVVGSDPDIPWRTSALITADEEVLIESASARYAIAPTLQLLKSTPYQRIAMVGLPCELEALHKMRNLDVPVPVADKVRFTIELACSSSTPSEGTRHIISNRLGLDPAEVSDLRYRAGDYPGKFTVATRSGVRRQLPFFEIVKDLQGFKTFRCKACPDWWSGLADISVADGDSNIFATSRNGVTGRPRSLVVMRTELGVRVARLATESNLISARPTTFDPRTSLGLQRKRHRYSRIAAERSRPVPTAPTDEPEVEEWKSDDEVIDTMSPRTNPRPDGRPGAQEAS